MIKQYNQSHREDEIELDGLKLYVIYDADWEGSGDFLSEIKSYIITIHTVFDEKGDEFTLSEEQVNRVESILEDRLQSD